MVWIRNNTFMAGFIAVMVIGVGVLGYLLYDSMGRYDQVSQDYTTNVAEMKRLQAKDPFPNQTNLSEYEKIRDNYRDAVDALQTKMATLEQPPENPPLSPTQFQDRLRKVVDDITKAADQFGVARPEDFYMGFERYRNSLPDPGATPALTSQLDSIQELVSLLIKARVDKIGKVAREILPQETGGAPAPSANPKGRGPQQSSADLISKVPVVLEFTGPESSFRGVLNDITQSKRLFVVRAVKIQNENDKGPVRGQPAPPGAPSTGATPAPGPDSTPNPADPLPAAAAPPLRYVVGQEKLNATIRVELVRVAPRA